MTLSTMVESHPRFASHLRVEVLPDEQAVILVSERQRQVLQGRLFTRLAQLMDGLHAWDEIYRELEKIGTPNDAFHAVERLSQLGCLVNDISPGVTASQEIYWHAVQGDAARLRAASVCVQSDEDEDGGLLVEMLRAEGISHDDRGDATLTLYLVDDYLRPSVLEANQRFLKHKSAWLLLKAGGIVPWIGPLFLAGQGACAECLAMRLRQHREMEALVARRQGESLVVAPQGALRSSRLAAYALAATEISKWIAGVDTSLIDHLLTLDTASMEIHRHRVVRMPHCTACGGVASREDEVILQSRPKGFVADGGHRVIPPTETIRRYEHLISPISGVIRKVIDASPEGHDAMRVYATSYPFPSAGSDLAVARHSIRARSSGKGRTDAQARAGAIAEALERYSSVYRGDETRLHSSYRTLGERAIHPNHCMLFSAAQYRDRLTPSDWLNPGYVPLPFDEEAALDWTPLWSLTRRELRYLPTEYCYFGHPETRFAPADTNGNAAGNVLEEAVLQGFLELMERDAAAIWWYNRIPRPRVDIDSFSDPWYASVVQYHARAQRELWVVDITADLGVSVFAAVSRRFDQTQEDIIFGFGAHLDPRIALSRAVSEMNQKLPFAMAASPLAGMPGATAETEPRLLRWWRTQTLMQHPHLTPNGEVRTAAHYCDRSHGDLLEDIAYCRRMVEQLGMEVLVLDQTRADVGLSVVRMVVPGLRHYFPRFAPGRLYEVPVQLGWRTQPLQEEALNPVAVFN